jgi:hypothetical protein
VGAALGDHPWSDALRGAGHLGELHLQGLRDAASMQLGMVWGIVTTPVRLVTRTIPAFATAVSERMQGRDRGWDVVFTGTMVEADLLGTYAVARPTGLVDRANFALERRLFGSLEAGAPPEFLPPGITGQWRNWSMPLGTSSCDQALSWSGVQRYGLWGPNRPLEEIPGPLLPDSSLQTLPAEGLSDLPLGSPGDRQTVLLWTADERGVNFIPEQTLWPTSRGYVTHTNVSTSAYAGGEAWRTGPNSMLVTSSSGAYGASLRTLTPAQLAEGASRFDAVIDFLQDLGLDVSSLPFGQR